MKKLKEKKIEKIVLAANWGLYDWVDIVNTFNKLRSLGIENIEVVGPVPQFKDSLHKQLYLYFKQDVFHRLPNRMSFGLVQKNFEIDNQLRKLSQDENIAYISPINILCNKDFECITRLADSGDALLSWDDGHLTKAGSIFLVSKFPKK